MRVALTLPLTALAALVSLSVSVSATTHHLFTGGFEVGYLYALEFDDEALTLTMVNNMTLDSENGHPWVALDSSRTHLYAAAGSGWASFDISENKTNLTQTGYLPLSGNCSSTSSNFILPASNGYAYGDPFGNCLNVMSIDSTTGALSAVVQNYTYANASSGVHGTALDPNEAYLYSADDSANMLWTHSVSSSDGTITLVSSVSGPAEGSDPRHLAVNPNGRRLYVVLEGANAVGEYTIDENTHEPGYVGAWSLIPTDQGLDNASYWSDEAQLSPSGSLLWASARARTTSDTDTAVGYLNLFSLDPSTGAIIDQLVQLPTSTSGGAANNIKPAFWTDEWVLLTDGEVGFVEIWQLQNTTSGGYNATAVARATLADGGCCANAVWVD